MNKCRFCSAEGEGMSVCMNTRDMEDFAIYDDGERGKRCLEALRARGGGEKGMRYVELNREHVAQQRTERAALSRCGATP